MKKIACLLIVALALAVPSAAYLINCDCPTELSVGETLALSGTSNLPPGFTTDIVLYRGAREIERQSFTIQDGGEWSVAFETAGLQGGVYKVEIEEKTLYVDREYIRYEFGSSSDTLKVITFIDRSGEIAVTSPLVQGFADTLLIAGTIEKKPNSAVKIGVVGPAGAVFGPAYVATDASGRFTADVQISETGPYEVTFSDAGGLITTETFTVKGATAPPTTQPTSAPAISIVEATADASRENPAFFAVATQDGGVRITTSAGVDWVVEYVDEDGTLKKVNTQGRLNPEEVRLSAQGGTVYLKVYPVRFNDEETVTIYAENVDSVTIAPEAAHIFGDAPEATSTPESPLPAALVLLAVVLACLMYFRR
ncbi:MAG TPA: hypothetical protein ENN85_05550 [Methanoculleus sp.]|nr:hypothetical protein [Methanoculleus sp.]